MTEYSSADKINYKEPPAPLLPRSGWTSQIAYLRAIFRAKKALDLVDLEVLEQN